MKGKKILVKSTHEKNIQDMVDHGAEVCIFNCPMCKQTLEGELTKKGMDSFFLSDLARLALGEKVA